MFDVIDQLSPNYPFLYFVDLDGIERNDPQLEYIQELSRDMPLWVDSGVRNADQAIDVLVAGAQKAILSCAYLHGPKELKRAWRLSTELIFEVETADAGAPALDAKWERADPLEVVRLAREVGLASLVYSPRGYDPDWALVAQFAAGGPTWVDGSFAPADAPRLVEANAAGGIFHIEEILAALDASPPGAASSSDPLRGAR